MSHDPDTSKSLDDAIRLFTGNRDERVDSDLQYRSNFVASGKSKAEAALATLYDLKVDQQRSAYFSIGGSSGSEIQHVLEGSEIKFGVLLEFDPGVAGEVAELVARMHDRGKTLVYVPGDATQQLGYAVSVLRGWHDDGDIDTVVCSAQAVLHELPTRSPGFHLEAFLAEALLGWRRSIFISREPCVPYGWPEAVQVAVDDASGKMLSQLAGDIQRHLSIPGDIRRVGEEFVEMSSQLAVEMLFKLFYIEDYHHEVEEAVTSIEPAALVRAIESHLGASTAVSTILSSDSFERHYRLHGVRARKSGTHERLGIPQTFISIVADSARSRVPRRQSSGMAANHGESAVTARTGPEFRRAPTIQGERIGVGKASQQQTAKTEARVPTLRRLRRRCRVVYRGSAEFRATIHSLLSRKRPPVVSRKIFFDAHSSLTGTYERKIAHAAYLENIGAVREMLPILRSFKLVGSQESTRRIYAALAHEKLDEIGAAQELLYEVIEIEASYSILRAAQFNLQVCYEKQRRYDKVDFESFIGDDSVATADGERLSDKAVAMHLSYCMDSGESFIYEAELAESLTHLAGSSPVGHAKTLLTRCAYLQRTVSTAELRQVLDATSVMDTNSRVAVLTTLLEYTDPDEYPDQIDLLERMRQEEAHPGREARTDPTSVKWRGE